MPYFVYVLKSTSKKTSYIGSTQDLENRLSEHNSGESKATRHKGPWSLVYQEKFQTRSEAVGREMYFKTVDGRIELKRLGIL